MCVPDDIESQMCLAALRSIDCWRSVVCAYNLRLVQEAIRCRIEHDEACMRTRPKRSYFKAMTWV
jgi:hypothetical protein